MSSLQEIVAFVGLLHMCEYTSIAELSLLHDVTQKAVFGQWPSG